MEVDLENILSEFIESDSGLAAIAAFGDSIEETDEPMDIPGNLISEHSMTFHGTGSQTDHNSPESSRTLNRPEAHPTYISKDAVVNSVPSDGTQPFMGGGDELYISGELQLDTSSASWKPGDSYGTSEESTMGSTQTDLVEVNPPHLALKYSEDEFFADGAWRLTDPRYDEVPKTPTSQYDEATASQIAGPLGNQSTWLNTEQLPEKRIPSISVVRATAMKASEEAGNENMDDLPDPADEEERRKEKNRQASQKARQNKKKIREDMQSENDSLEEEIKQLEPRHGTLQQEHKNALVSAAQCDKYISIGAYLEEYYAKLLMPLALITSRNNVNQDGNPALMNQEHTMLEVPVLPPAPPRLKDHRKPKSPNVETTEEEKKQISKEGSQRYRDEQKIYWEEIEERIPALKKKLHALKHNITFFEKRERQRDTEDKLRKSILGRQFIEVMPSVEVTKFIMPGWFYSVCLTKNEFDSLGVVNGHLGLPSSPGCFHFITTSRPGEKIMVLDFTPDLPKLSDVPPS